MRSDATLRSSARLAPLALFGVLTACHPAAPVKRADLAPLPAPEAALAELRAAGAKRQNLRALGRLTYFGEKGRVRLKAVLVADRPNRVRFETVSPLEQPLDVMTVDGSRLYLLSKEKLAIGPATPENVARLLPFPMHPEELVDTLLGGVPTSARFTPSKIAWNDAGDRWLLTLDGVAGDSAVVTADPVRRVVVAMDLRDAGGNVRMGVTFEDFEVAGDSGELPRTIHVKMPGRDLEVDLKLKEVDVNVALDDALFTIVPPEGITPERLDSPPVALPVKPSTALEGPGE